MYLPHEAHGGHLQPGRLGPSSWLYSDTENATSSTPYGATVREGADSLELDCESGDVAGQGIASIAVPLAPSGLAQESDCQSVLPPVAVHGSTISASGYECIGAGSAGECTPTTGLRGRSDASRCGECSGPLDAKLTCWPCQERHCRCGRRTGSVLIEICRLCEVSKPIGNKQRFVVTLEIDRHRHAYRWLAKWLKACWRGYGLKCIDAYEVKNLHPESPEGDKQL